MKTERNFEPKSGETAEHLADFPDAGPEVVFPRHIEGPERREDFLCPAFSLGFVGPDGGHDDERDRAPHGAQHGGGDRIG